MAAPRPRMVVTDLDGTLLRADGTFGEADLAALREEVLSGAGERAR